MAESLFVNNPRLAEHSVVFKYGSASNNKLIIRAIAEYGPCTLQELVVHFAKLKRKPSEKSASVRYQERKSKGATIYRLRSRLIDEGFISIRSENGDREGAQYLLSTSGSIAALYLLEDPFIMLEACSTTNPFFSIARLLLKNGLDKEVISAIFIEPLKKGVINRHINLNDDLAEVERGAKRAVIEGYAEQIKNGNLTEKQIMLMESVLNSEAARITLNHLAVSSLQKFLIPFGMVVSYACTNYPKLKLEILLNPLYRLARVELPELPPIGVASLNNRKIRYDSSRGYHWKD